MRAASNLVRAVLATAADVPEPARHVIERFKGEQGVMEVCGYGLISESDALTSRDNVSRSVPRTVSGLDTFKDLRSADSRRVSQSPRL